MRMLYLIVEEDIIEILKNYEDLINPLNSVLLSKKFERDNDLIYTKCVATPNGWTFIIPNKGQCILWVFV